jgi:hypothetical protein
LIEGAPGQINNTGAISANVDDGAALFAGGTITNSATGSIKGLVGPVAADVFIQYHSRSAGIDLPFKTGVLSPSFGWAFPLTFVPAVLAQA